MPFGILAKRSLSEKFRLLSLSESPETLEFKSRTFSCSLQEAIPDLENAHAVCRKPFPFWKMPPQSAGSHSRSGKRPRSLQEGIPILENVPAVCRGIFPFWNRSLQTAWSFF